MENAGDFHRNFSIHTIFNGFFSLSGIFHHYQRSHTKFVIATNLPDVKVRTNITRNIVKPEWIADSLKENRLLDYSKYLLYTNKNRAQPQINFKPAKKEEIIEDPFMMDLKALTAKLAESDANDQKPEDVAKTGTAVDSNFLEEFLNNSRLHHIATLGSGFKYHINDLRKNHDGNFPHREELCSLKKCEIIPNCNELVMHIDMDCFFVSVSLRKHPHLRGLPVAVTHSKGKNESKSAEDFSSYSEIASCSYEARAKGLKNGMFVGQAMKLCPELKTIPYDFEEYRQTAFTLYNTLAKFTLDIEAVSCDELYADLKNLVCEYKFEVMEFIAKLRQEIFDKTGCTCSVGLGANRLQARMATKEAKPNGQFSLLAVDIEDYMKNKAIRDLPGVGPNTAYQLTQLKLETCGQLQNLPLQILQQTFGKKFGETLQQMSRGLDEKKLVFEQMRKSVSVEVNYGIRFNEDQEVHVFLKQVADELSKRLKEIEKKGKLLTLKIMVRAKDAAMETMKFMGHGVAEKLSKSVTLLASTDDAATIHNNVLKLLTAFNVPPFNLRGLGVQMSKLDEEKKDSKLLEMFKKAAERQQNAPPMQRITLEPIKIKTESPKKVKKVSPAKKRGRPSKLSTMKNSSVTSVTDLFTTKKITKVSVKRQIEMIDPEVLAELPPEMVDEILREYQIPDDEPEVESFEESPVKFEAKVDEIPKEDSNENIFLKKNWQEISKILICENLEKVQHDAAQLIRRGDLNVLFTAMRFLLRTSGEEKNFESIVNYVQEEMLKTFGKKLLVF